MKTIKAMVLKDFGGFTNVFKEGQIIEFKQETADSPLYFLWFTENREEYAWIVTDKDPHWGELYRRL